MNLVDWNKLDLIYEDIKQDVSFSHLRIGKNRLVPGEGDNPAAMLIGEAPGAQEATQLRPFVGPSGVMLRRLMQTAGLSASPDRQHPSMMGKNDSVNCWLTNVIKYRPPKNRTPTWPEIQDARPYLRQEWEAIGKPPVIVCIGSPALTAIVGRQTGVLAKAGTPFENTKHNRYPATITVWPMIHPGYGLRNKSIRPQMEAHWSKLGSWLWSAWRQDVARSYH